MASDNRDRYTLKIHLNVWEQDRLNQLATLTHSTKAAVLKRSLYCSDISGSADTVMRIVEPAFFRIDSALDNRDYRTVREEMMKLCRTLNCVSSAGRTTEK